MINQVTSGIYGEIIETLDIPESAYEKAENRYKDLGDWFARPEAKCSKFDPHIYPQGSFRLGTVIRPLGDNGEYDLDLGCRLRQGITKFTYTQKQLKTLVGLDLAEYRIARKIVNPLDEKHRCWRLHYEDELNFHMDAVPSIPEEQQQTRLLSEAMIKAGTAASFAQDTASYAGAITDNRSPYYSIINQNWRISNSEGYARWFESQAKLAMALLEKRAREVRAARVDDLPVRKWKTPLQQAVQILKRHRDVMFVDNPDSKPASIIITTLAGRAYRGEVDIGDALTQILTSMDVLVNERTPHVINPVNPSENFTDKWADPSHLHLRLRENFFRWVGQAKLDLQSIGNARNADLIIKEARSKFAVTLNSDRLNAKLGVWGGGGLLKAAVAPVAGLSFPAKPLIPSKPAGFA